MVLSYDLTTEIIFNTKNRTPPTPLPLEPFRCVLASLWVCPSVGWLVGNQFLVTMSYGLSVGLSVGLKSICF